MQMLTEQRVVHTPNPNPNPNPNSRKHRQSEHKGKLFLCWKCEKETCSGYDKCRYHHKQCSKCLGYGHAPNSRLCKKKASKSDKERRSKTRAYTAEITSSESSESPDTRNIDPSSDSDSTHEGSEDNKENVKYIRAKTP